MELQVSSSLDYDNNYYIRYNRTGKYSNKKITSWGYIYGADSFCINMTEKYIGVLWLAIIMIIDAGKYHLYGITRDLP